MITGITLKLQENTQNVAENKTNVTISATITWGGGSHDAAGKPLTLLLDGVQADYQAAVPFNAAGAYSGSQVFYTYTADIPHDFTGQKTLHATLVYATTLSGGTRTTEGTWTLTPIARATTIGASDANVGAVATISVNRKSAAYTHTIMYQFGSLSGYLTADGAVSATPVQLTATSIPFAIPEIFYDQIPNSPTGVCYLTCKTYSGETQIGADQAASFTITAPQAACTPAVSGKVVDTNPVTTLLTGNPSRMIRYKSTALCTITAEAKNGASVASKSIGGLAVTGNTRTLAAVETDAVGFDVTDSRGYSNTAVVAFELIPYVILTAVVSAKRTDPTSGKATLQVKGNYFNDTFGAKANTLTIQYRVNAGEAQAMTAVLEGNTYTAEADLTGLDYLKSHTVEVAVTDALGTTTGKATIGKGIPVFDWGENDFVFHVPVTVPDPASDTQAVNLGSLRAQALPKAGGTLTGHLLSNHGGGSFPPGGFVASGVSAYVQSYDSADVSGARRQLELRNQSVGVADAVVLSQTANGNTWETFRIYGEHCKPTPAEIGAIRMETQSAATAGNSDSVFTFTGAVQAVCVTLVYGEYTASGFWTPATSGKTDRFYGGMGAAVDFWNTKVNISGNTVTVKRDGATAVTYAVTALVA